MRLKKISEHLKLKQYILAQRLGVSAGFISKMISGQEDITGKILISLSENFPTVNVDWLMKGDGDMMRPDTLKTVEEPGSKYQNVPDDPFGDLKQLLAYYEQRIKVLEADVERLKEHVFKK